MAITSSSDRADLSVAAGPSASDYMALWWRGEVRATEAELIAWARRERLLPLLGWRAEVEGWTLPAELEAAIRRRRQLVAIGQVLADEQLMALGATATALGIAVVLVKGAAAAAAYPAPWMRPYSDIDVLVDESESARWVAALLAERYTRVEGALGNRHEHLPPLKPADGGLWVETHTSLAWVQDHALFSLRTWADDLRRASSYPGLWVPHPTDHVLYLVFHGVVQHELEERVQALSDLKFWTREWGDREWDRLCAKAGTSGLLRAVGLALALTAWFWQAPWPEGVSARFPTPPASLLARAQEGLVGGDTHERLPHVWRRLSSCSPAGLFSYLRLVLLGDPSQREAMTRRERFQHLAQRPGRLLRNHGASLWWLVRGDPATREAWRAQRALQGWLRGEEG